MFLLKFLAVFGVFFVCSAQRISLGGCEEIDVVKNFDVKQYVGEWYEIEKYPVPFEAGLKCNKAVYEDKGDYVSVVNSGVKTRNGELESIEGKATIPDKNEPAKLLVKFDSMPFKSNYWVLDTDYKGYSVVYSCFSVLNSVHFEYLWILSRTPTLNQQTRDNIYKFLEDKKINTEKLEKTVQDCTSS